ncbi:hypothetical protein [Jidongwangia harbinensis]|uniref:hypothetical protein n=1 Tax=Jidongwangia harbinensis TaxID=2878561 RepID=UPI001CD9D587|nr:hypothetical protein [Jidongwangia harbinensis]MCA2212032.1 hypothetical protein [Jidongwangia harbinensis]
MRRTTILTTLLAASLSLAACGDGSRAEAPRSAIFDGPVYASVAELDADADAVAIGSATAVHGRLTEGELYGAAKLGGAEGLPIALYEVQVKNTIKGAAARTILVTRIDQRRLATAEQTVFPLHRDLMFFLRDTATTLDGMPVYSVVGMDQGWLRIAEGRLHAVSRTNGKAGPGDGQTVVAVAASVR